MLDGALQKSWHDIEFEATSTVGQEGPRFSVYWRDNPATQTALLSTKDEQVQTLIHQIREHHENLAGKLLALFTMAKEENPNQIGIAADSLSNFYHFLQLYSLKQEPILSLSPDYNIYASWRRQNQVFSAHFLPNANIRFVLRPSRLKRSVRFCCFLNNRFY